MGATGLMTNHPEKFWLRQKRTESFPKCKNFAPPDDLTLDNPITDGRKITLQ